MLAVPFEDEGEAFDFDDSGDDIPEADRLPPAPPAPLEPNTEAQSQDSIVVGHPEGHLSRLDPPVPSATVGAAPSTVATARSPTGGITAEREGTSAAEGSGYMETDLLPPPPPPLHDDVEANPGKTGLCPKKY